MLRLGALTLLLTAVSHTAMAQHVIHQDFTEERLVETSKDTIVQTAHPVISEAITPTEIVSDNALITGNDVPIAAAPIQEKCITIMSGFPNEDHVPRYQFFKLTQELTRDVTPTFRSTLDYFGDSSVNEQTLVTDVIENIANPVYRQAAPEITIGNMGYLIDFALDCESYLTGQIESLEAFDPSLTDSEFNVVISEDALFMRQILSDTLFRVGAQDHEVFGPFVHDYANSLVTTRDRIEFAGFESELESLEAVFMTDLDGKLARSNDVINNEMDQETLASALEITDDMNQEAKMKSKQKMLRTLSSILGGR